MKNPFDVTYLALVRTWRLDSRERPGDQAGSRQLPCDVDPATDTEMEASALGACHEFHPPYGLDADPTSTF